MLRKIYAVVLVLSGSIVLHAQENAFSANSIEADFQEIVVTARRKKEKAREVPISLKAYKSDDVEETQIKDLQDVVDRTPSLNYSTSAGNHLTPNFTIRGVGSAVVGAGVDQAVSFYYDDVFLANAPLLNFDLYDIERVEVLRGPQGGLYGKNAFAGVIKVYTNKPENKNESSVELTLGNLEAYKLTGYSNFKLIDDKLFGRISALINSRGGFVENTGGPQDDIPTQRTWSIRGQLRAILGDSWDVIWSFDYIKDRPVVTAAGDFDTIVNDTAAILDPYDEQRDILGTSIRVEKTKEHWNLTSITGVRGVAFNSNGSDFSASDNFNQGQGANQIQVSEELRWAFHQKRKSKWAVGLFSLYEDIDNTGFAELTGLAGAFGVSSGNFESLVANTVTSTFSVFGENTWNWAPKWELNTALRYLFETKRMNYIHTAAPGSTAKFATDQEFSGSEDFSALIPKTTLSYQWKDNVKFFGSIGRGYKSGGFNNLLVNGGNFAFEEETAWNYELGTRTSWWQNRLLADFTAFYFEWDNQQVQVFNDQLGTVVANATDSFSRGFEVDLEARPWHKLTMNFNYSYSKAQFRTFADFPTPVTGDLDRTTDVTGNRTPFASENSWAFGTKYEDRITAKWDWFTRWEVHHKGAFFFDSTNLLRQPGYKIVNAALGAKGENQEVIIWVKNLQDRRFRTFAINRGVLGTAAIVGEPRLFGISYRHTF